MAPRAMLLLPLAVLAVAAGGWVLCTVTGWHPHGRELLIAAIGAVVAGELGLVPTLLARKASQLVAAQVALIGTLIHLFALAALAAGMFLGAKPDAAFLYWLVACYWATLIVLVVALTAIVRSAPLETAPR